MEEETASQSDQCGSYMILIGTRKFLTKPLFSGKNIFQATVTSIVFVFQVSCKKIGRVLVSKLAMSSMHVTSCAISRRFKEHK